MQGVENPGRRETETWRFNIVIVVKGGQAVKVKGTYHCQTTQQPNTLNSWDIRSVSVDLPEEEDKPYWHKVAASVIGGGLVAIGWWLVFGY